MTRPTRALPLLAALLLGAAPARAQPAALALANRAYASIPFSPDFNAQQFTLATWLAPAGPGENGGGTLLSKSGRPDQGNLLCSWWLGWATDGRILGMVVHDYGVSGRVVTSNARVPLGARAHAALTFDGAALKLYINGRLDREEPFGFSGVYYSTEPVMIGAFNADTRYTFNRFDGRLDDAAVWNRALSAGEVASLSACDPALPQAGLLVHLPFTDASLADASGHGHAAAAVGPVAFGPDLAAFGLCPADFNCDGFLDFFDYDDYVNCFESAACPPGRTADFNSDGFADFFDYDDFVAAFQAGC